MPKAVKQGMMATVLGRMAASETLISDRHSDAMLVGLLGEAERVEDPSAAWESVRGDLAVTWGDDLDSEGRKSFVYRDGVAVIPVHGILINRFPYCWGFVTGYDFIRNQMNAAAADPDVKLIVFDHDTPGGEAAGCDELAREINELEKPTMALVNSLSCSGGYWLAAPCNRVVCAPSASVGSIGVYILVMDISKLLAEEGVGFDYIQRGKFKTSGSPYKEMSSEDREYLQSMVDERYDEFVAAVAKFRGIEESVARDTEARVMRPTEAIALGLIDAAVNPVKAVGDFIAELDATGVEDPGSEDELEDESMADLTPAERAAIAQEERQRISGITTHVEAKGRESLAQHLAHNTDMTVEAAAGILAASPKVEDEKPTEGEDDKKDPAAEPKNAGKADEGSTDKDGNKVDDKDDASKDDAKGKSQFEQAMDTGKHPEIGGNGGAQGEDKVAAILKSQELATGRKPRA